MSLERDELDSLGEADPAEATPRAPRVLVAVALDEALELDDASRRTLEQALWLAERCQAHVRLIHVLESYDDTNGDEVDPEHRDLTLEHVESLLKRWCHEGTRRGLDMSAAIASGRPSTEILHEARHWPADLLVIGTHLGSEHDDDEHPLLDQIDRLVHGSTAHRLLRKAPCAVWVVSSRGAPGIQRVLVAVDLGAHSAELVGLADRLHALTGADRALLHCIEFSDDLALNLRADAHAIIEACEDDLAAEARQRVEALLGDDHIHWEIELRASSVERVIGEVVEDLGCDLVIAGSSGRDTLVGALGDTAGQLVDRVPASTWIVRTTPATARASAESAAPASRVPPT